jgi:hypothetical protein
MSYHCTKTVCCQEKYIVGELLVRTEWEVVGDSRVIEVRYSLNATAWCLLLIQETLRYVRLP